jgi:hypothetical protein
MEKLGFKVPGVNWMRHNGGSIQLAWEAQALTIARHCIA